MALTKFTDNVEIIQALSNTPNATEGLTADQLKAKFDDAANKIKTYLNDTLTEEIDVIDTAVSGLDTAVSGLDTAVSGLDTAVSGLDTAVSNKIDKTAVVDSLISTSATDPLSANQGKILAGGTLKSKIIVITRDGQGANGDVSYTGVGFKPTSVKAIMAVAGTLYKSNGFADSAGTSRCQYTSAANVERMGDWLIVYSDQISWVQHGKVKSYDADGLTITWEKVGAPAAGTMDIFLLCER